MMRFLLTVGLLVVAGPLLGQESEAPITEAPITEAPFAPLESAEQARLDKLLATWEQHSQATQTFACDFQHWHYDVLAAPTGVHAVKETGRLVYAAPDKALYRITEQLKPKPRLGAHGTHWIVNGPNLAWVDHESKNVGVWEFPTSKAAGDIAKNALPLVFQIDAKELQERFWVREIQPPKENLYLIEAWPKSNVDQSRWNTIQVALDSDTLVPRALIVYAANFKISQRWSHYEFKNVKRNLPEQKLPDFEKNFSLESKPGWNVQRESIEAVSPFVRRFFR